MHLALVTVDDDGIAVLRHRDGANHLTGDGYADGTRDDDDMAGDRTLFQHQPAQALARIVEKLGRAHGAGDDDGIARQRVGHGFRPSAQQQLEQPVGEIVEIAHALAQIGVGHVQHARAHVALHLLDRGFRRQAVADRFLEPAHPAAIVGEHAVGFQHLAVLAVKGDLAPREHVVDGQAQ